MLELVMEEGAGVRELESTGESLLLFIFSCSYTTRLLPLGMFSV